VSFSILGGNSGDWPIGKGAQGGGLPVGAVKVDPVAVVFMIVKITIRETPPGKRKKHIKLFK